MSAFRKIVATTALTLAASTASAALLTETGTFGVQGSSSNVGIGTLAETISINSFNTALGSLTGVDVRVFGQMDSSGSSQNASAVNGRADVGINIFSDWKVSTAAAADFVFKAAHFTTPFLSDQSSVAPTFDMAPGDIFTYNLSSGEITSALSGVILSAFTTGSTVDFNFSAFATTTINNDVESGTGFFTNSFNTGSWGKVEVDYTYTATPPTAGVPIPGTLALVGLGLGLLAMRARKSA